MPRILRFCFAALAVTLAGCNQPADPDSLATLGPPALAIEQETGIRNPVSPGGDVAWSMEQLHRAALWKGYEAGGRWAAAYEADRVADAEAARRAQAATSGQAAATSGQAVSGSGSYLGLDCGGDLPPCFVLRRENPTGDPQIWNGMCHAPYGWTGISPCGTSSASGVWQFVRGTWAKFHGYLNAADAPVWVQNLKAVLTWAGGAGCGHWDACT